MAENSSAISARNLRELLEQQSVDSFPDKASVLRNFIDGDTLLQILTNDGETRVLAISCVFDSTTVVLDDVRELCAVILTAFSIAAGNPIAGFDDISPNLKVAALKLAGKWKTPSSKLS